MSRQSIISHYTRLAARWPKDILRPEKTFQSVLSGRVQQPPVPFRNEEKEVNAAYLLLEKNFSKRWQVPAKLMRPQSNPEHYERLESELKIIPTRSVLAGWMMRLRNMVRFK